MTTLAVTSVSSLRCQTSTLKTVRACLPLRKPPNSWDSAITPSTRRSSAKRLAALRCESQKPEAEHNILRYRINRRDAEYIQMGEFGFLV